MSDDKYVRHFVSDDKHDFNHSKLEQQAPLVFAKFQYPFNLLSDYACSLIWNVCMYDKICTYACNLLLVYTYVGEYVCSASVYMRACE